MMDSVEFKVNTDMYLHYISFSNDIMILIVLLLLSAFAWIFRLNIPLFGKMISNISVGVQRQSIFETTENDSFLLAAFLTFQTLLLLSIFLLTFTIKYKFIINIDVATTLLYIGILLAAVFVFFLLKRLFYLLSGAIFIEQSARNRMIISLQSLFYIWGVSLYIPVLWLLLFDTYLYIPVILLVISFLAYEVVLALRIIDAFFNKNTGLLFLSLYLCAQEIVPLVFLYEGLVYIYNIIEVNFTWQ